MSDYLVIVDGFVKSISGSLEDAKGWVDAGNYQGRDGAKSEIRIAKVLLEKKRNKPTPPKKMYSDWRKLR